MFTRPPLRPLLEASLPGCAFFLLGLLLLTLTSHHEDRCSRLSSSGRQLQTQKQILHLQESFFLQVIKQMKSESALMADNRLLFNYILASTSERAGKMTPLQQELMRLLRQNPLYRSLSLVDSRGREVIRVDRSSGPVPKKDHSTAKESDRTRITTGRLPLYSAVSGGFGCAAASGHRPVPEDLVYRLLTPVGEEQQGWYLLLNLNAWQLFSELQSFALPGTELTVVDSGGFYLFSLDQKLLMTQFLSDRPSANIARSQPQLDQLIRHNSSGSLQQGEWNTLFQNIKGRENEKTERLCTLISSWQQKEESRVSGAMAESQQLLEREQLTILFLCSIFLSVCWFSIRRIATGRGLLSGLETAGPPLCIRDGRGDVLCANASFRTLSGWSVEELRGGAGEKFYPEGDSPGFRPKLMKSLLRGENFHCELTTDRADGSPLELEGSIQPVQLFSGMPPVLILTSWRDITLQHKMERELEELTYNDSLTGMRNSRYFHLRLNRLAEMAAYTSGKESSCAIAALSFYQKDGTPPTEVQLLTLARLFALSLRRIDLAARMTEGDFALLLPYTSEERAVQLILRFHELTAQQFAHSLHSCAGMSIVIGSEEGDAAWKRATSGCAQAAQEGKKLIRIPSPAPVRPQAS